MVDQQLTFYGWARERIASGGIGVQDGRVLVSTTITLSGTAADGSPTTSADGAVRFLLAGPGDVRHLETGTIIKRYPTPGTIDHESDRSPHVEFADVTLPWRYTPAPRPAAGSGAQHPWLVLVVGEPDTELTVGPDQVTLTPVVQRAHPLGAPSEAYRWAHVQEDAEGRRIARVLCGRTPLLPGTDYVAVLVPAFDATGQKRWSGTASVTVPWYDIWRFRTATPAGSFEDLAGMLEPGVADPETGRAPLDYPRLPAIADLEVRGALAPLGAGDDPLPGDVHDDLDALRTPARDEKGRPIVGLPRYGDPWRARAPEETTWGAGLNTDPRDRAVAGLGLELGIRLQEDLAREVAAQQGAVAEARQRIRDLVLGLQAAGGLWNRRMPADPLDRLWLVGPALARVVTPDGAVADLATDGDRPLPAGLFSSAVRRILRPGTARAKLAAPGAIAPRNVLVSANRCPRGPGRSDDGVPLRELGIEVHELVERLRRTRETGEVDRDSLMERAKELADTAHPELADLTARLIERLASSERPPWTAALTVLLAAAAADERRLGDVAEALRALIERFPDDDPVEVLIGFEDPEPDEPPCRPVDLTALAGVVGTAFDPTKVDGAARVRVLSTIDGLDPAQPLAPPEVCVGLDRPVWNDVRNAFDEWLLPGIGKLPENSVIAVETNPRFVDALLVGLNTQVLGELRWRNIPVATGCTPLRLFWSRRDTATGTPIPDITGIQNWSDASAMGTSQHRPPGVPGRDLVIVIRGQLFLRYPTTVVYLVTAEHAGAADFTRDPDPAAAHVLPGFQGRIGTDVTFFGFQGLDPEVVLRHWLVLEEPPAGYRFANDQSVAAAPHTWAAASFARPVRVLIRGDRLDPEG
ncbi:hypothetical protein [Cellulomonas xiejunii]|uniref:hypothetical protein n=1 Tax=Cellulomonas xiejunii TaxID=2968083 RepID=UPI001D0E4892|nr:hypothetical protein [Cellulomonas xiejunii]MCC2313609.1 hypothetical protein [Cellulomonas xiejunii]